MSLAPKAIRYRVEESIRVAMSAAGWEVSRHPYAWFPGSPDTRDVAVQSYAVGLLTSEPDPRGRQRLTGSNPVNDVLCTTFVGVRFSYELQVDDGVASTDEALDAELQLVAAVLQLERDPDLNIWLVEVGTRAVVGDGTLYLGELRFKVQHGYPLTGPPTGT